MVSCEAMVSPGVPRFALVGLPDKAVSEARERILGAFSAIGLAIPPKKIVVNLAPADVAKEGSHFDLPIALAILGALDIVPADRIEGYMAMGELSLSGDIRPVSGILPAAAAAQAASLGMVCPGEQRGEALWAGNKDAIGARDLRSLINHLNGVQLIASEVAPAVFEESYSVDMSEIRGQDSARRALEIAASGGHHMLMIGPPGVGKSMLAQRLPTILPPMTGAEALESSIIYSVAGMIREGALCISRPFRAPHHTASQAALTGGGMRAKPGEASLAHNGVLFLDELPEFASASLDSLRQPLENGVITVARANGHITYPARFQLVAAMNPCKCGYFGDPNRSCAQVPLCAVKYQNRISGPMYDRIDLTVEVESVNPWELDRLRPSEPSAAIRARVIAARQRQLARFGVLNSGLSGKQIEEQGLFESAASRMLAGASEKLRLSARGYFKTMRIARTIADMDARETVRESDVAEALLFRRKV
jgi:magnesium chelatase family protein